MIKKNQSHKQKNSLPKFRLSGDFESNFRFEQRKKIKKTSDTCYIQYQKAKNKRRFEQRMKKNTEQNVGDL